MQELERLVAVLQTLAVVALVLFVALEMLGREESVQAVGERGRSGFGGGVCGLAGGSGGVAGGVTEELVDSKEREGAVDRAT